jgi:hypothetical protein
MLELEKGGGVCKKYFRQEVQLGGVRWVSYRYLNTVLFEILNLYPYEYTLLTWSFEKLDQDWRLYVLLSILARGTDGFWR